MKARVKLEGPVLEITFTGVQDSDRGHMANIEIALLRTLKRLSHRPWVHASEMGKPDSEGCLVQLVRGDSTYKDLLNACKVLEVFCLLPRRCNFCRSRSQQCPDCAAEEGGYKE